MAVTPEKMKAWLDANQDKAGTPDFVQVTEDYTKATTPLEQPPASVGAADAATITGKPSLSPWLGAALGAGDAPAIGAPAPTPPPSGYNAAPFKPTWYNPSTWFDSAVPEGQPMPSLQERLAVDRGGESPNSFNNIADRAVTGLITAGPDLAIQLNNIAARSAGYPEGQINPIAPQLRAAAGSQEMPADAHWSQRLAEGVLPALAGGVASGSALPRVAGGGGYTGTVRTAAPAVTGWAGAEGATAAAQSDMGKTLGLDKVDPELMMLLGGVAGSGVPRMVGNIGRHTIAALYGGSGKNEPPGSGMPGAGEIYDAAVRSGITPNVNMVGDRDTRQQWIALENRPGSKQDMWDANNLARRQISQSAQEVPTSAGATMREPVRIGQAANELAGEALTALEDRNATRQQTMQNQIGGDTPVNVADLDRTLSGIVEPPAHARNLPPNMAPPVQTRLNELREMYPPPDPANPAVQGPPSPEVRLTPFIKWRNDMLTRREGEPPIAGPETAPATTAARDAYRDTAIAHGVPGSQFDFTQERSRALPGQTETLAPISPRTEAGGTTNYNDAYTRLLMEGGGNPQLLRDFSSAVNHGVGVPAGAPRIRDIFASHLNNAIDTFLRYRNDSALGPTNFANFLRGISDPSLRMFAGSQQGADRLRDIQTVGNAMHRPTVQGGGQAAAADIVGQQASAVINPLLASAGALLAGGADAGAGTAALGGLLQKTLTRPIDRMRGAIMSSPSAAAGAAGRPVPTLPNYNPVDISRALQAMHAAPPELP